MGVNKLCDFCETIHEAANAAYYCLKTEPGNPVKLHGEVI